MSPSTFVTASASAILCMSWLNRRPHTVAVYASQRSSPSATQHSLTGGRYPLPARDFHPLELASFSWRTTNLTNKAEFTAVDLLASFMRFVVL